MQIKLHRHPTSPSPQEDLFILPSGTDLWLKMISNYLVEFEIFATAYIIEESLVADQIGCVADRCFSRHASISFLVHGGK